ncbi:MAG: hypothetical protein GY782_09690 [Gammaproteobacteria bacterium]|nr:hypothetical protein [Gammaproteobacteria bacterium]
MPEINKQHSENNKSKKEYEVDARADILNFPRRGAEGILELRRGAIIVLI